MGAVQGAAQTSLGEALPLWRGVDKTPNRRCVSLKFWVSVCAFILVSLPLAGQAFYGSAVGTVTDSSGAVMEGATVTLTNTGMSERHVFPRVETEPTGFST
jgi:hypothetical protein